jgi:hypothetical protein
VNRDTGKGAHELSGGRAIDAEGNPPASSHQSGLLEERGCQAVGPLTAACARGRLIEREQLARKLIAGGPRGSPAAS